MPGNFRLTGSSKKPSASSNRGFPLQAEQYSSYRYFEVIGSDTGKRYRIRHGRMMNVDELDSVGNIQDPGQFGAGCF
jgi:hypothetical protein